MKLSSLLHPSLVRCGLAATTKDEALAEMARLLEAHDPSLAEAEILAALAEREKQGPFSIGKGIAFPHARTEKAKEFTVVLATAPAGIDFKAADGVRVRIAALFVIPKKHSNLYLQILAAFLNVFADDRNTQRALGARTGEELIEAIAAIENAPHDASSPATRPAEVASVAIDAPLSAALAALEAARAEALPVVDGEGNLVGEITASAILQLGVRDHLLALPAPASLASPGPLEEAIRRRGGVPIGALGIVNPNGFATVQEDESAIDLAVRLAGAGGRGAYVLRGRRLVGRLGPMDLLRRLAPGEGR